MTDYPKTPCELCGKPITTFPAPREQHMKKCRQEHAMPDPEHTAPPAAAARPQVEDKPKTEPQRTEPAPDGAALNKISDPKLRELMLRALAQVEQFAKAPEIFVAEQSSDEMLELRKRYLPESVPVYDNAGRLLKPPEKHCFFGEQRNREIDVGRGYVPVVNERGEHVQVPGTQNDPGNYMYWCPQEMHDRRVKRAQDESDMFTRQRLDELRNKQGKGGISDVDGVQEEEFGVTQVAPEEI